MVNNINNNIWNIIFNFVCCELLCELFNTVGLLTDQLIDWRVVIFEFQNHYGIQLLTKNC